MKKAKILLAMLLALSVFTFTGCGSSNNADDGTDNGGAAVEESTDNAGQDLKDDAKDLGDDVKDGVDDMMDGTDDSTDNADKNTDKTDKNKDDKDKDTTN